MVLVRWGFSTFRFMLDSIFIYIWNPILNCIRIELHKNIVGQKHGIKFAVNCIYMRGQFLTFSK
jgi:hypothetical protein